MAPPASSVDLLILLRAPATTLQGVHTGDSITVAPVQTLTDKVGRRGTCDACLRAGCNWFQ